MNVDALAQTLGGMVCKRIAAGQFELPALPWHRNKLAALLKGRMDPEAAVAVLERDPLLVAECMKALPRSPRVRTVTTVADLVSALGVANLNRLLSAVSRRRSPDPRNVDMRQAFERVCARGVGAAVVGRQAAVHAAIAEPDSVVLGGLVFGAAGPMVALHLLDLERAASRSRGMSISPQAFIDVIEKVSPLVAIALVDRFVEPSFVRDVVEDPQEYEVSDRKSPANCLRLALFVVARAGIVLGDVDSGAIDAGLMIGRSMLNVRDDALGHMMDAARVVDESCSL